MRRYVAMDAEPNAKAEVEDWAQDEEAQARSKASAEEFLGDQDVQAKLRAVGVNIGEAPPEPVRPNKIRFRTTPRAKS